MYMLTINKGFYNVFWVFVCSECVKLQLRSLKEGGYVKILNCFDDLAYEP